MSDARPKLRREPVSLRDRARLRRGGKTRAHGGRIFNGPRSRFLHRGPITPLLSDLALTGFLLRVGEDANLYITSALCTSPPFASLISGTWVGRKFLLFDWAGMYPSAPSRGLPCSGGNRIWLGRRSRGRVLIIKRRMLVRSCRRRLFGFRLWSNWLRTMS